MKNLKTDFYLVHPLATAALLLVLTYVIILTGCGSTANKDGSAHEHSTGQDSCH